MSTRDDIKIQVRTENARRGACLMALADLPLEIIDLATEAFGSADGAAEWLVMDSHVALGGRSVFEAAKTPQGLEDIRRLIGAIEHGVYL